MPYVLVALLAVLLSSPVLAQVAPSLGERRALIKAMDMNVPPEAAERKARSEHALAAEGVPINSFLPVIEIEQSAQHRSKDEIARRALVLLSVAGKAEGMPQALLERILKNYELETSLSPKEKAFVGDAEPSLYDRQQFVWRYEAAWVLLWALGYVDSLDKPAAIADVARAVRFMKERSAGQFMADAKLRPLSDILDQADKIYRYHWAVVDARVNARPIPAGLNPDVILERHQALNWLIGHMGEAWDDISTDT
ncbi:DUF4272 domain-containing protein [Uliginosibacterium sediminicola]|uniref:DUF4272 domain-containing protein n=1 Tax=Uliginosibacterium sediminicola TaxID=2024550 RepID=A0ABU9YZL9_9RHOO